MRKIVFVSFILFILASSIYAGEFYNCIDRDGNTILINSPQDGMKKCVLKESYKDPTPQERAREQSQEAESSRNRQANEAQEAARKQNERQQAQQQEQQKQREAKKKEPSCYLTKESCTVSGGIVSGGTVSGGMLIGGTVSGGSEHCHATEVCTDEYGHETRKRVKTR